MRLLRTSFALLSVFAAAWGCMRQNPFAEGEIVARVGNKKLYVNEVQSLFTPGLTPQDSVKLLESYVDMWIKKQLKVGEAEELFSANTAEIDAKVEEYRASLLTHRLDQYYIDTRLDTLVSAQQISDYYNEHRSDFTLDRTIVKGAIVKFPEKYRQRKQLKELMGGTGEKYKDFLETSAKNEFPVTQYDSWVDFSDFLGHLPASRQRNYDHMLTSKGVQEMTDDKDMYYVLITDSRKAGDQAPLERVSDNIRRVLLNQRRQEIIRNHEDSIYNAAKAINEIEIKITN